VVIAVVVRLRVLDWVVEEWASEVSVGSAERSIDVASQSLDASEAKEDIEDAFASNN
jgi:hypothetical protein